MLDRKKLQKLLVVFVLSCQLIACARPDLLTAVITDAPPQAVDITTATQPLPVPTATETSVPMQEPALPPIFSTETLPVTPPKFETAEELAEIPFDLTAAHAVYAYYRQEVGPLYNLPEASFIQEMSQYYTTTLEPNGIHLVQSMGDSAAYGLLTRGSQFFAYFTPDGILADYVPGHWNKTDKGQWVEAGGTNDPLELYIGEDGLAYITQLGTNDGIVYRFFNPIGATIYNLDEQWVPVEDGRSTLSWSDEEKKWVKTYDTTEYTGIFSEKYGPKISKSYVYKDEALGIEFPLHLGISEHFPEIVDFNLTDSGLSILGETWLIACYTQYAGIMGNQATLAEYKALVALGEGKIIVNYYDELTREKKETLIDPREGISVTITGDKGMPLRISGANSLHPVSSYQTVNREGTLIIAGENNLEIHQEATANFVKEGKGDLRDFYKNVFYMLFLNAVERFSSITSLDFLQGKGASGVLNQLYLDNKTGLLDGWDWMGLELVLDK